MYKEKYMTTLKERDRQKLQQIYSLVRQNYSKPCLLFLHAIHVMFKLRVISFVTAISSSGIRCVRVPCR